MLMVPAGTSAWRDSIVQPIPYAISPAFNGLADLVARRAPTQGHREWQDEMERHGSRGRGADRRRRRDAHHRPVRTACLRREDRAARRRAAGRTDGSHRAHRRQRSGHRPPVAARRDAAPVGGAVRSRPARRRGAGRLAGWPLHDLRLVAMREHGPRAPGRNAAAVSAPRHLLSVSVGSSGPTSARARLKTGGYTDLQLRPPPRFCS